MFPRPVGVRKVLVSVTGVTPQEVIAPVAGHSITLTSVALHERSGLFVDVDMYEGGDPYFDMTIGPSGTIVWDSFDSRHELSPGSGFYISLSVSGDVGVRASYVLYDRRAPSNLDPLTYVPQTTRTPDYFGQQ